MGFSEISFLFVFLPAAVLLYLLCDRLFHKDTVNNALLVLLSLVFYYWSGRESLLIFLQIVLLTYLGGFAGKRRAVLPIVCLVGFLVFYKYAEYVLGLFHAKNLLPFEKLIAPIGLSFVIFEAVSYVADIARGEAEPGNLLDCMAFLSLFPKLVSGPIVLWREFQPQLKGRRTDLETLSAGIDRIIVGYAKKLILADTFGAQISLISAHIAVGDADVATVWLRSLLYFFQLYYDFSGYSDIAIGLCGIFGFKLRENFRYPYLSRSISEFWRRWHISLGSWFREYVYIPLGGNRRGSVYLHLCIVFLLTGIWHGAGLQFVAWGCVQALCVVAERAIRDRDWYRRIPELVKWLCTTAVIFFSWILFMAPGPRAALANYKQLFVPMTEAVSFTWRYYLSGRITVFLLIAALGNLTGLDRVRGRLERLFTGSKGTVVRRVLLLLLFAADLLYAVNSSYSPFLYFQF